MKKCCGLCPYSMEGTLFLHPDTASDFAYSADNPYNDFVCHKTGIVDDDSEEYGSEIVRGEKSLTCMGFASMQHNINDNFIEEGFKSDPTAFSDSWEMIDFHQEEWDRKHKIVKEN